MEEEMEEEETEEEETEETGKIEEWEVGFAVMVVVVVVVDVSVEVDVCAGLICVFIRVLWCTLSTVFLDCLFEL